MATFYLLPLVTRVIQRETGMHTRQSQVAVVADPHMPYVYGVRVRRRHGVEEYVLYASGPLDLRTTTVELEEVTFTAWPPRTIYYRRNP